MPITGLLAVAGIAFGVMSQSALAAAASPAAPASAATKTPQPTTAVVAAKAITPTAAPTYTLAMGSADYLASAEAVYSDTTRAIKTVAATLSANGALNVKAVQSSLADMSVISAKAQALAATPGEYANVGKKLALLAKKIDAASANVAAELKQTTPDAAKIKKAFSPVANEADSLNSVLHKAMMAMGATPTVSATKTASMGKLPANAVAPIDANTCPADHAIKGNKQSHIYHLPTSKTYKETKPEVCFATTVDAEAGGYRAEKK